MVFSCFFHGNTLPCYQCKYEDYIRRKKENQRRNEQIHDLSDLKKDLEGHGYVLDD